MSSRDEVERLLDRITEVDPLVRAVCARADDAALAEADARDAEQAAGRTRSPLHGRPVLVKDNVDTAGLATTAGSLALAGAPPARDAALVTRLREAGMVVLGKTNLSEWANIRDVGSTSGWSGYGGLTRNPYARNRSAGGSSSGSGAAVAAGLAPYAVGTETDGSITCPAAFNGCVGLKPTVGLVPTDGVVPISSTQDTPGPMTSNVEQAAALLDALSGVAGHAGAAVAGSLEGVRIGLPRTPFWGYSRHADAAAERAVGLLSGAGATVVDAELPAATGPGAEDDPDAAELLVMLAELRAGLTTYLGGREGAGVRTLADVVAFNAAHAEDELTHFGQGLFEQSLAGPEVGSQEYAAARATCRAHGAGRIDAALREHAVDLLLSPSYPPAIAIDLVNGDHLAGACSQPAALAGYPLLTVPSGLAHGLPVAVTFWGAARSEPLLLRVGAAYERLRDDDTGPLPPPTFPDFV